MSGKKQKVYITAQNGFKIEVSALNAASIYMLEQVRNEIAVAFQVPKDMLFPDKELIGITVHEPRLNVVLTDELKNKGSVEIKFDFHSCLRNRHQRGESVDRLLSKKRLPRRRKI